MKRGRKKGNRRKGYYYRAGRGWQGMVNGKSVQLYDANGNKLADRATPVSVVEAALGRVRMPNHSELTVHDVCEAFLVSGQGSTRKKTHQLRANYMFDFCTGLPSKFVDCPEKATSKDKQHAGYGHIKVSDLTHKHLHEWVANHGWHGRVGRQCIKRAFSWAASEEVQLIKVNPLKGLKAGRPRARVTYFTKEQEDALCEKASKALALVIRAMIRTGCRPGEIAILTAAHVEETSKGQVWRLAPHEHKTGHNGKWRVVRVPSDIAAITRELIEKYPEGTLFRTPRERRWITQRMSQEFRYVKQKLIKAGWQFSKDDCLYSCRHTFAKRLLGGYWTGKPATIETVAGAMGNSRQVAWESYGKWCEAYDDPLWSVLG